MNFSEIFKDMISDNDITAKRLAKKIKIQDSTLYKYMSGTLPRIENAVSIANYFNCSLNYLMGIDEEPQKVRFKNTFDKSLFYKRYSKLLNDNSIAHFSLSKEIDLNVSSLYAWKNGTVPNLEVLSKIAIYFSCSIDYLVGRADKF